MKENTAAIHAQIPVDVATFLLNEKRADIWKIEARFKVSVVLIPNIHLETPHFSVSRLRSDDLAEVDRPSYELMEAPAEAAETEAAAEPAKPRPVAVVRGITPAQPAPVVAEKEPEKKEAWISKVAGWFTGLFAGEKKEEAAPAPRRPAGRGERAEQRGRGRGRGRERDRERGEGRGPRAEGQRPQQARAERPERAEKPAAPVERAVEAPVAETAGAEGQERGGRRGRRGRGRDRGERGERREEGAVVAAPEAQAAKPEGERGERRERGERGGRDRQRRERGPREKPAAAEGHVIEAIIEDAAATRAAKESIVSASMAAREAAPAPVAVPSSAQSELPFSAPEAAPAPVKPQEAVIEAIVEVARPAPAPTKAPEPVNLEAAGLVMIETSRDKISAVAPVVEEPAKPRGPRPKPAWTQQVVVSNEPMQQVETRQE